MQKQLFLLCAVLVLTTASPHYYRQHFQYEQQSESYKNNELQHKKEEAGRYAKVEDGTSAPIEKSAFHQAEYHAPGADDDSSQASVSLTGHGGSGNTQRYQQQSSFRKEWSQQNAGTSGGADLGSTGSGNSNMHHMQGQGYGHHGHQSHISGTGSSSQSLTSATGSGSPGIYGTDNSGYATHGQTHHSGRGHHRHHSQSFTGDSTVTPLHSPTSQTYRRYGTNHQTPLEASLYPGYIRAVPVSTIPIENPESSSVVPTSHRREWHHQTSSNTQHPGRGHGYGVGHQTGRGYHHNHGNVQTVDTTRSESSLTQQKEETQRGYGVDGTQTQHIVEVGDVDHGHHGPGRGHGHHGHGRGRGHHEHGRGHGYGHQKYDSETVYTSYPQRSHTDYDDNENKNIQTGQVSDTGTTFSTSSGTNTAAQNSGTAFYSESSGTASHQSKLIGTSTDSNRYTPGKLSGTGTVFSGESPRTGTNTNRQYSNVDDSSTTYGSGTVPHSGVVVPSTQSVGTGTVTHQTSRTYSVSQSKLSGTTAPQTTTYVGSGRPYLVSPHGPTINRGNLRGVPTTTENVKPVYEPEPEAEEPSSNDKDRLKNIFQEVNRKVLEDASLVTEQHSPGGIQKPVQVQQRPTTNQQTVHQTRNVYQSTGYTRTRDQNQQKIEDDYDDDTKDLTQQTEDEFDDLTQQSQHGFDDLINTQQKPTNLDKLKTENQQGRTYTSLHTQTFGKLDKKDLTQQTEDDFDDLTQQSQDGFDDLTQQTQHGFEDTHQVQKEYKFTPIITQQKPTILDNPKVDNQERTYTSRQTQRQYQTQQIQHGSDDTQQVQKEYTFTPINTQQKPRTDNQQVGTSSQQTQRLYHSQGRVEKTEFAVQPQEVVTPEPAAGYWKITPQQQPQTGYGTLEFSGQQHEDDQEDLTQQQEDVFSQQQDLTQQHQEGFEFNTQQTQNKFDKVGHVTQQTQDGFGQIAAGNQYQQPQYSSGRVVKITQQNQDLTKQSQIDFGKLDNDNKYEDLSQKTDDLETVSNTGSKVQGAGYSSSSSYSRSSSYSAQQQPQVIYSPMQIGSKSGQMQVYQTMQIPAGASEEMKRKLEEQLKHQLELKMQELQSQHHSSQYSMSPVHVGTQSGTGQLQVYQTMQIPAGASAELRHKLEEQLRQQLEQKMQELRMQQQSRTQVHQSSSQPLLVQSYSTGQGADCDEQTGGAAYSSSYSSSSSAGTVGGKHYSMRLSPGSSVSSSGSSFQMSRQMQHPGSGYSY